MILKDKPTIKRYLSHLGADVIAKIKRAKTFADIGCAKGQLLKLLHAEFKKPKENLFGFDVSKKFIAETKKSFPHVYCWNFTYKKPPRQKFDVVFVLDVLEHIENPFKFLRNIIALMKNDSILVLSTPNINSFSYFIQKHKWFGFKDKTHKIFYCRASLFHLLEQYGLKVSKFKTISSTGFSFYDKMISALCLGGQILLVAEKKK